MTPDQAPRGQSIPATHAQPLLDSATNAVDLGGQQFFTRPEFADALLTPLVAVPHYYGEQRMTIADLTGCGNGALLKAARKRYGTNSLLFGSDIDPRMASSGLGNSTYIDTADITRLHELLATCQFTTKLAVINPPFSLNWHRDRLDSLATSGKVRVADTYNRLVKSRAETIDSTLGAYLIALDRLAFSGEGVMLTTWSAWQKHIAATPAADHAWLTVRLPKSGHLFEPSCGDYDFAAIYFAEQHRAGPKRHLDAADSTSPEALATLLSEQVDRHRDRDGMAPTPDSTNGNTRSAWHAAAREYTQRHDPEHKPDWNLCLDPDGRIITHLTPFQNLSGNIPREALAALQELHGETPMGLTVQRNSRRTLHNSVHNQLWRVDPALISAVETAIQQYQSERAPLYPLPAVQRLGYLDEEDRVECRRDFQAGDTLFRSGQLYPIETATEEATYTTEILDSKGDTNEVKRTGRELVLTIYADDKRHPQKAHKFILGGKYRYEISGKQGDSQQVSTFADFIDYFTVPEVTDIAALHPERYAENLRVVGEIEDVINQNLEMAKS